MRLLALDLATSTGHACGDTAGQPMYGTMRLPSTGDDVGRFLIAFDEWLRAMIAVENVETIVFEAPVLTRGRTSIQTARKLMALATHTEFVAVSLRIACREASIQSVKKFWTNDGRAEKEAMMKMARIYGYAPHDDNACDALALFFYAAQLLDPKNCRAPGGPLLMRATA